MPLLGPLSVLVPEPLSVPVELKEKPQYLPVHSSLDKTLHFREFYLASASKEKIYREWGQPYTFLYKLPVSVPANANSKTPLPILTPRCKSIVELEQWILAKIGQHSSQPVPPPQKPVSITLDQVRPALTPGEEFWARLAQGVAKCLLEIPSAYSIKLPTVPDGLTYVEPPGDRWSSARTMSVGDLLTKMRSVTDLLSLKNNLVWLVHACDEGSTPIDVTRELERATAVVMFWPCRNGWVYYDLGYGWGDSSAKTLSNSLADLVFEKASNEQQFTPSPKRLLEDSQQSSSSIYKKSKPDQTPGLKKMTECKEPGRRRLEQGDAAVHVNGHTSGAFNWRTIHDADGKELECFDYFMKVHVDPVAPSAVEPAKEIARPSLLGNHSRASGRKFSDLAAFATSFLTLGLIVGVLWRRKKWRAANKKKPLTASQIHTPLQGAVKRGKPQPATKELDGCSTTADPRFANCTAATSKS
eukprot:GHVT01078769.1.p1 GENE.GHVT01078769.1~~GHVT01078769.1.p1  ORF type:complete len:471 (+),score=26.82 GHVT01078769.1:410-1822(+)